MKFSGRFCAVWLGNVFVVAAACVFSAWESWAAAFAGGALLIFLGRHYVVPGSFRQRDSGESKQCGHAESQQRDHDESQQRDDAVEKLFPL